MHETMKPQAKQGIISFNPLAPVPLSSPYEVYSLSLSTHAHTGTEKMLLWKWLLCREAQLWHLVDTAGIKSTSLAPTNQAPESYLNMADNAVVFYLFTVFTFAFFPSSTTVCLLNPTTWAHFIL